MSDQLNPYAPPQHDGPAPSSSGQGNPELEAIRREHITAETNVKTVGGLCYIGAVFGMISGVAALEDDAALAMIIIVVSAAMGLAGYWLRRLDRKGRAVYSLVAALAIVGTLIPVLTSGGEAYDLGYATGRLLWPMIMLAVLWVEKASTVMTPHYRDVVIPATPHVKRKTSPLVIVLLVLLLALIGIALVSVLLT